MEACALNGFFAPAQRARFLEAVPHRYSVRTFSGTPDAAQRSALHYAAERVCLPGVRIAMDECCPEKLFFKFPLTPGVTGTNRYAALIVDEDAERAYLHAGVSGEAFVLETVSLGLGTCWQASFKRRGLTVDVAANERVAAIMPLGVPGEEQRLMKRKALSQICVGDPTAWPLWAYHAAECVRRAPSAMNLQPWRIAFAGRTLLLKRAGFGGPLDMGIALLHMSLGVGDKAHVLRWGEGREIAALIAEDRL